MDVKQLFDLSGKAALITGGSRGLGLQMAEALGELGAKVALIARKQGELDEAAKHLGEKGIQVLTIAGDLSHFEGIPKMVDVVLGKFGGIDILVNNAGTTWGAPAESYPAEAWKKVMDLNINAMFFLTQDVGRRSMIPKRSGKIINVASVAGLHAGPSKMTRGLLEKMEDKIVAATPLRRLGGPEDLKGTIALLASEASRHITGQYIVVDGGSSIA